MGPGDYRVADFLRAGSAMTVLFLVVSLLMLNIVFQTGSYHFRLIARIMRSPIALLESNS